MGRRILEQIFYRYPRTIKFWGVKLTHRFLTLEGLASLTPVFFKGQLYSNFCLKAPKTGKLRQLILLFDTFECFIVVVLCCYILAKFLVLSQN